ncbi:MAG: RNA polymerase sigma-70 factor [Bacteroidia bacterium]|nr:RNA polymerase sigma-70 factor [Bacteroidia bacterium]
MSKEQPSDKQLIGQIQKSDNHAFRLLFDRFYRLLLGLAMSLLKDLEMARDAVQEVFFQIWKTRETLEIQGTVAAYLKQAVVNRSLNQLRQKKPFSGREPDPEEGSDAPTPLQILEGDELGAVLQRALDALPERCRLVFVMKRMEGKSHQEIGELLNISPKTIENQMTKALSILKNAVQAYEEFNQR